MLCFWYLSEKFWDKKDFTVPTTKLINILIHPKLFKKRFMFFILYFFLPF